MRVLRNRRRLRLRGNEWARPVIGRPLGPNSPTSHEGCRLRVVIRADASLITAPPPRSDRSRYRPPMPHRGRARPLDSGVRALLRHPLVKPTLWNVYPPGEVLRTRRGLPTIPIGRLHRLAIARPFYAEANRGHSGMVPLPTTAPDVPEPGDGAQCRCGTQSNVTATAFDRFDVAFPWLESRCQAWKHQVSPLCTAMAPIACGRARGSAIVTSLPWLVVC